MKLALTGDVMLGRLVNDVMLRDPRRDPADVWGDTLALFDEADARLINLECVIALRGEPWRPLEKAFHFRADPRALETLRAARIDAVSLANNHILDFGSEALIECCSLLDEAGIVRAGAGCDETEAHRPAFIRRAGLTIGLISLTDNEPEWEAGDRVPGLFHVSYDSQGLTARHHGEVEAVLRSARHSCDVLIVAAHVGPNWGEPSVSMQTGAREIIGLGADCYWGHSNHTPQGIEIYRSRPILYSAGDFVDDYAVDSSDRNDLSFLFFLDWESGGWRLTLVPTKISEYQVNRACGGEAELVMERMQERSAAFQTELLHKGDRLAVEAKF